MSSNLAIKLYVMIKNGIIKSNANFWRDFSKEKIESIEIDLGFYKNELNKKNINLTCVFDDDFPKFNIKLKNNENPFLFAYKGNINLLSEINRNIAVIGVLTPTIEIKKREQKVVEFLVKNNLYVVSGLARGCDTIAHKTCLENGGKTIAILPTTFESIYPNENESLLNEIVKNGGLIITEYMTESQNRFESVKRFIERDRLQALLTKAVVLIASFRQGQGDSGSRHAMQKAEEYGKKRFVMFNHQTDNDKAILGLNQDLLNEKDVINLTEKSIKELIN